MEGYYAEILETYIWNNPGGYNMVIPGQVYVLTYKQKQKNAEKNQKYMQRLLELYIRQNETELLRRFINSIIN
jgi:hypothetical protein